MSQFVNMPPIKDIKEFSLKTIGGVDVLGEYEGNVFGKRVVIFVHGFGSKRDSYGFFTQIGDFVKDNYAVVRFDLNTFAEVDGKKRMVVQPVFVQAQMLNSVVEWCGGELQTDGIRDKDIEITVVAHSLGGLVSAVAANDRVDKYILLAPTPDSPYERMKGYFQKREGSVFNEGGISKFPKSDGSWVYAESSLWADLQKHDTVSLYKKLASHAEVVIVRAKDDQVISADAYSELKIACENDQTRRLRYVEIPGNHMFEGEARGGVLKVIGREFLR